MEFFKHGSNAALAAALLAIAILAFHALSLPAAAIGAALFFVSEYTTHRFLFHARPVNLRWVNALQHRLHYDHHVDPAKADLLFLPLWFTVPTALLYFGIYAAATRSAALALSLTFGSLLALLWYEWTHYVAHRPIVPLTPFGKFLKKYHLWHHFKNEHLWYGVTNPTMDVLLRTYRAVSDTERSDTVREIWRA